MQYVSILCDAFRGHIPLAGGVGQRLKILDRPLGIAIFFVSLHRDITRPYAIPGPKRV